MKKKGKLYLIPTPIGDDTLPTIPQYVIDILHQLDYFIAERAKTARHFIKKTNPVKAFNELKFSELNKRTTLTEISKMLQPAEAGNDMGLLSEAGCPGVADPGAVIVEMAHRKGIDVVPLVGPSSILLALMGSGMNGQSFSFSGYLGAKKPDLTRDLKRLEQLVKKHKQTQIFIETPYRNGQMIEVALATLNVNTRFCIAVDLTLPTEFILTKSVEEWKEMTIPDFHKKPAIFLIG